MFGLTNKRVKVKLQTSRAERREVRPGTFADFVHQEGDVVELPAAEARAYLERGWAVPAGENDELTAVVGETQPKGWDPYPEPHFPGVW